MQGSSDQSTWCSRPSFPSQARLAEEKRKREEEAREEERRRKEEERERKVRALQAPPGHARAAGTLLPMATEKDVPALQLVGSLAL